MTFQSLAESYLKKSLARFDTLDVLLKKDDYSDVIREAQEIVELCLKGMLRYKGIEPPKYHDVSGFLFEYRDKFSEINDEDLRKIASISKKLRKERELSFYGDIDFIPTESYTKSDASEAIEDARFVLDVAEKFISKTI